VTATLLAPPPAGGELVDQVEQLCTAQPSLDYLDGPLSKLRERRMQYRFHTAGQRFRAMFPGNGAGKTTTMGVEVDWWIQHNHPYRRIPTWPILAVWFTLKFQQFEVLREQLERKCLTRGWRWDGQKHCYKWANGGRLFIFSADADWSAAQGINPDLICFDENPPVKIWREMQMRRRGDKKTEFLVAATATKGLTWMFSDLFQPWLEFHEKLGMSEDQAMVAQLHPHIFCWPRGGLEDNPGADEDDKRHYNEVVRYGSAAEKAVRTGGGFQDLNSSPVFDPDAIEALKKEAIDPPPRQGILKQITTAELRQHPERPIEFQFVPTGTAHQGGRITIFEPPIEGEEYGIGADTGWGLATSDFSTISVGRRWKDPISGATHVYQVAEAEGRWSSVPFTWVLWALGWFYNEALVAIERNNGGLEVCRQLYDQRGYIRQYFEQKDKSKDVKHTDLLGFTKHDDRIITRVHHFIGPANDAGEQLTSRLHLRSIFAWRQMQQYQFRPRNETDELESVGDDELIMSAPPGQHDDLVIATAAMLLACINIVAIPRRTPLFKRGSAGDVLKHAAVLAPEKPVGAFSKGKRRLQRTTPR
jgi:hypothetical protein